MDSRPCTSSPCALRDFILRFVCPASLLTLRRVNADPQAGPLAMMCIRERAKLAVRRKDPLRAVPVGENGMVTELNHDRRGAELEISRNIQSEPASLDYAALPLSERVGGDERR